MSEQICNKLVRDNIPNIIENSGREAFIKKLNDEEFKKCLDKKLQEEVKEYIESDNIEELADIYEVISAILKYKNIELEELIKVAENKANKNGKFDERIYLEKIISK